MPARVLVARTGAALPPPPARDRGGWIYGPGGPGWSLRLPDGRILVARAPMRHRHPAVNLTLFLGLIALVVAACAYPVVRGLTRRLERLQTGVETLGAGDLSARVQVSGRDEVARLAASFNRAAARIEELVHAHRMLLSNASHELRTPLSRIRLGIELFQEKGDPKYKAELERDIAELDLLIDEILLASRLDTKLPDVGASEELDLLGLAAEECARYDCTPEGEPVTVRGDPRLLRRLVRNLLENARRHGKPPVRVEVRPEQGLRCSASWMPARGFRKPSASACSCRSTGSAPTRRAPGSASLWCGRSRACTAATRWSRRAPGRQAAFGSRCRGVSGSPCATPQWRENFSFMHLLVANLG